MKISMIEKKIFGRARANPTKSDLHCTRSTTHTGERNGFPRLAVLVRRRCTGAERSRSREGPTVRIHFPPPASLLRTRLPLLAHHGTTAFDAELGLPW